MNKQEWFNANVIYNDKVIKTGIWASSEENAWDKLYWKHENADKVKIITDPNRGKSQGQIDYEMDLKRKPIYHDGTPRKKWEELSDISRWSWERKNK